MAKVGYGIIGCGNIGPVHAAAIAAVPSAKLVAVSDVVERTAKTLADQYGAAMYTDYRQLLERKDIQAVCLCVPSGMRMEIAVDCAAAGKNVLSEKPLDVSTKRIDRIIAATDKAGVRLGCIFQSRFADGSALIKQALDQGRFGTLVLGDAYIKWYRSPEYYASGAWRGTKKWDGGGALMNQGIHQIDLLQWFMGPVKRARPGDAPPAPRPGGGGHRHGDARIQRRLRRDRGSTAIWPGHSGAWKFTAARAALSPRTAPSSSGSLPSAKPSMPKSKPS